MATTKPGSRVEPIHLQVGGDADIGGIAQTITSQDIDALLVADAPVDERLEALKAMRSELEARLAADRGNEIAPLIDEVDAAIAQLMHASISAG